jgi:hypothetical protein
MKSIGENDLIADPFRKSRWGILFAAILSAFALTSGGAAVLALAYEAPQEWKGFRVIAVESDVDIPSTERIINEAGVRTLSRHSCTVEFFDYSGFSSLSVAGLEDRFEPSDPRLDPYMRGIGGYFSVDTAAGPRELVYLETGLSTRKLTRLLRSILSDGSWSLLGGRGGVWTFLPIPLAAAASAVLFLFGKKRPLSFAGIIPWIGPLCILPPFAAPFIPVALFCWLRYSERISDSFLRSLHAEAPSFLIRKIGREGIPFACCLLPLFFLSIFMGGGFLGILILLCSFLGMISILMVWILLTIRRYGKQEHPLFFRIPILEERTGVLPPRAFVQPVSAIAFSFLLLLLPTGFPARAEGPFPRPLRGAPAISWESIALLGENRSPDLLPDLSDYLSHMAFQEGFSFGREYRFPVRDEEIKISRYNWNGKRIERSDVTAKRFTEDWYEGIMSLAEAHGIPRLLIAQGQPCFASQEGRCSPGSRRPPMLFYISSGSLPPSCRP